jgi:hypothetical protein
VSLSEKADRVSLTEMLEKVLVKHDLGALVRQGKASGDVDRKEVLAAPADIPAIEVLAIGLEVIGERLIPEVDVHPAGEDSRSASDVKTQGRLGLGNGSESITLTLVVKRRALVYLRDPESA